MPTSVETIWETIAREAEHESPLWAAALRPEGSREAVAVFSPLADERFALGVESIYEGDGAILLGDYLYAHGLVRITTLGDVDAVARLAELLSLCAHLRAQGQGGDGEAWAATIGSLGETEPAQEAVDRALSRHAERVD